MVRMASLFVSQRRRRNVVPLPRRCAHESLVTRARPMPVVPKLAYLRLQPYSHYRGRKSCATQFTRLFWRNALTVSIYAGWSDGDGMSCATVTILGLGQAASVEL